MRYIKVKKLELCTKLPAHVKNVGEKKEMFKRN